MITVSRHVVTLYLQAGEYEFLRRYAHERRKSMSAVLRDCLTRLQAGVPGQSDPSGFERAPGAVPGEVLLCGAEIGRDACMPYTAGADVGQAPVTDQRQGLVQELAKASESLLRSGLFAALAQSAGTDPQSATPLPAFEKPLSEEIVGNREELRRK